MTPDWERAAHDGDIKTLRRLREAGSDLDQLDRYGQTALMLSARQGHTSVVAWLIEESAELDHASKYGLSATMLASVNAHADIARLLASAGADLDLQGSGARGFEGKTALDLATDQGHSNVIEALRGH